MEAVATRPDAAAGATPQRSLCVGGWTPFSTADWPGQIATVVFVQGCPWRCVYCHNPHLQARCATAPGTPDWASIRAWLLRRRGLLDAVVFSGGEPTIDPALPAAMADVRALGFRVGLHTAGMAPRRLQPLLPLLDWVGLDIKAPLGGASAQDVAVADVAMKDGAPSDGAVHDTAIHDRITGRADSSAPVRRSLELLGACGIDFECRTTAHPALLDDAALCRLADELAAAGVRRWALQICRATGCATPLPAVAEGYPTAATLDHLRGCCADFTLRAAA